MTFRVFCSFFCSSHVLQEKQIRKWLCILTTEVSFTWSVRSYDRDFWSHGHSCCCSSLQINKVLQVIWFKYINTNKILKSLQSVRHTTRPSSMSVFVCRGLVPDLLDGILTHKLTRTDAVCQSQQAHTDQHELLQENGTPVLRKTMTANADRPALHTPFQTRDKIIG